MNNRPTTFIQLCHTKPLSFVLALVITLYFTSLHSAANNCKYDLQSEILQELACSKDQSKTLPNIHFYKNSSHLSPKTRTALDEYIPALILHPEIMLEVAVYTDNSGPKGWNKRLSHERAHTARLYMVFKGVNANQLLAKGYGEKNPIASNKNKVGRLKNRRLELKLLQPPM